MATFGAMTYFLKVGQSPKVHFGTSPKLPVHALNSYIKKKSYVHQLGPMTHFLMNQNIDPVLYFWGSCLHTHLQSFLHMP